MFIDIHNHILPYLDDGAKDEMRTLEMLKIAADENIKEIIATPHYIRGVTNYAPESYQESYTKVQEMIEKNNLDIQLYSGNEIFIDINTIKDLKEEKCLALANSNYILIELSNRWNPSVVDRILYELKIKGYRIILAHIERYDYFIDHPELLKQFISEGIYCQINANSIICQDRRMRRYTRTLLEKQLIHFVATDAHDDRIRAPKIKEAYAAVAALIGEKAQELFYANGKKLILNKEI